MAEIVKDLFKQALKYTQEGKLDKAIETYRAIIQKTPKDTRVLNNLGDIYLRKKMMPEAGNLFCTLAQIYEEDGYTLRAIAICQKVLKIDPEALRVKTRMADLYARQGLTAEARTQYLDLANLYDKKGQVKEALEIFRKLADLDPTNHAVRIKLGNMFQKERMLDKAAQEWAKAADACLKAGRASEARQLLEKVIEVQPDGAEARIMLAGEEIRLNNDEQAIKILRPVVEGQDPNGEALKLYAAALLKREQWSEAAAVLKTALEKEPSSLPIRENLGLALLKSGTYEQAAENLLKNISAHLRDNRWDRAEKLAVELLQYNPDDAQVLQRLVEIHQKSGHRESLLAAYRDLAALYEKKGLKKNVLGIYEKLREAEPENPLWKAKVAEMGDSLGIARAGKGPAPGGEAGAAADTAVEATAEEIAAISAGGDEVEVEVDLEAMSPRTPMEEVEQLLRRGLFKEAEARLRGMLAAGPSLESLRMLKELQRLQDRSAPFVEACLDTAAFLEKEGRDEEALVEYQEVLQVDAGNRRAKDALAALVLRLGIESPVPEGAAEPAAAAERAGAEGVVEIPDLELEMEGELDLEKLAGEITARAETPMPAGEVPPGPQTDDLLAEADFYHQQGLLEEAEKIYRSILDHEPGRTDVAVRLSELEAKIQTAPPAAAPAEEPPPFLGEGTGPVKPGVKFRVASEKPVEKAVERAGDFSDFLSSLKEEVESPPESRIPPPEVEESLNAIFKEFQQGVKEQLSPEDHETHYNLGIAYKEMGLLDEAIGEFQLASGSDDFYIDAASMIALCHKDRGDLEQAVLAFESALVRLEPGAEGRKGLLWELAGIFEQMGQKQKAADVYLSIHEMDQTYRGIGEKLGELGLRIEGGGAPAPPEAAKGTDAPFEKPAAKKSTKVSFI